MPAAIQRFAGLRKQGELHSRLPEIYFWYYSSKEFVEWARWQRSKPPLPD